MELQKIYIRTDKNGTKYYDVTEPCWKCSGTGKFPHYMHVYGGICFECDGRGAINHTVKEYTEAYLAKKAERDAKKEAKRLAEEEARRAAWNPVDDVKKMGYGETIGLVIAKDGSFDYGDDFEWLRKHASCNWQFKVHGLITSVGNTLLEGSRFQILPVCWDELLEADFDNCRLTWKMDSGRQALKNHSYSFPEPKFESGFVGAEGEKLEVKAKLMHRSGWFETKFGDMRIYTFEDGAHNKLVWKTGAGMEADIGDYVSIKAIVKEHSEYQGEKQTVLTRCKVVAA